ncbi:hypothetical protein BH09BAC5_BH09BAC5_25310 [soil metagenome]
MKKSKKINFDLLDDFDMEVVSRPLTASEKATLSAVIAADKEKNKKRKRAA